MTKVYNAAQVQNEALDTQGLIVTSAKAIQYSNLDYDPLWEEKERLRAKHFTEVEVQVDILLEESVQSSIHEAASVR